MGLVPTRVGMIEMLGIIAGVNGTCPHTRGDDPKYLASGYTV